MDASQKGATQDSLDKPRSADDKLSEMWSDYVVEAFKKGVPSHFDLLRMTLGITDEVALAILRLAAESKLRPTEVLYKALGLFKLTLDAEAEGNRIAILDGDDQIIQEVVGIEHADAAPQPATRS